MTTFTRADGRTAQQLRPVKLQRGYSRFAQGSCLVEFGNTRVLCTATVEERTQPFLQGTGSGWITAEYSMLPGSTPVRSPREAARGRLSGRTQEIQRLIGRSLRASVDLKTIGERTITVDCDCLDADGGTRTAAITGGFVALVDALRHLVRKGRLDVLPVIDHVAAVSVGIIDGTLCVDLPYEEDSRAEVDMNLVMTGSGGFVELQGTAEAEPFSREVLDEMVQAGSEAIAQLVEMQRAALGAP